MKRDGRDRLLLEIVRDGAGRIDFRRLDLEYSRRMAHTSERLAEAVRRIEEEGLIADHGRDRGPHGPIELTAAGVAALDEPDCWLGSTEHPYWAAPRAVTVRRRLTGPGGRVALVVEVDPPAQSVHDGEPRATWLITNRYAGDTVEPIERWPVDVHVLRPKEPALLDADSFDEGDVTIEAWAELYPTRDAAAATTGGA